MCGLIVIPFLEIASMTAFNDTLSRRDFGKIAGRVAAASALAGLSIPSVYAAGDPTIQIALIGCGGGGPPRRAMRCM